MDTKKSRETSDLKIKVATQNKSKKVHIHGKADTELRSNPSLLQTTLDTSFNYIQVFKAVRDKQGKIIDFIWVLNNQKMIEKEGDRVGKSLLQLNPGVLPSGIFECFVQVTETGVPQTNEVYYNYEGYEDWFHQTIAKLDDGFVLTGEIITERKKAEQEVLRLKDELAQKTTDKYLAIFNSIAEGFHITEVIFDKNNKPIDIEILEENPAARKILGGSFVGKRLKSLNPDYPEERLQLWTEVVRTGENRRITIHSEIWNKWFEYNLTKLGDKNSNKVALVFQDITERKSVEEALRKSEEKLVMDLADTKLLQSISSHFISEHDLPSLYEQLLEAATTIMHAEMGDIQLFIPERNELLLLTWKGFTEEIAESWKWVGKDSGTICSEAFNVNKRIIIRDIEDCEFVKKAGSLKGLLSAGIRAGQSTPLITRSGQFVGMISTMWNKIHEPSERELHLLDILARQAADVIEKKQREENFLTHLQEEVDNRTIALKESKDLLQNISEAVPDMISVQEYPSRKMIYYNRESYALNGFSVEELSKMTVEERHNLIHPDDKERLKKYVEGFAFLSDNELATIEYRSRNKQNNWIWLHARGKVFERDEQGNPKSIVNVIQNVSSQKDTEEEVAIINAELKTFNTITANNYTEALRHIYINLESIVTIDGRNLSDTSKGNLRKAQASIQKMKLLTDNIHNYLELYDVELKKELINPTDVLNEVKAKMQKKLEDSNATINISNLPELNTDRVLLLKLMINIIDNSIKFKKPGADPVVNVRFSSIADPNIDPRAKKNTAYTLITVNDNGIGFNKEDENKVFDLFVQLDTKHKGAGIGLAICKKIMEMHGGFITAESEVGKGTSIHCYFPS